MQVATHKHSGTRGTIMGYHSGRKAYFIRTTTGQEQYWTEDSTIRGIDIMTSKIRIKLTGKKKHWYNTIERYFDRAEDARSYLKEMSLFNDIRNFSNDNKQALLSNGWKITSTHDLKILLKGKGSKSKRSLDKILRSNKAVTIPSNYKSPDDISKPRKKKKPTGKVIKLQELTDNPRKARVILRGLVRQKKIEKPARWEWEPGSEDLSIVKKALGK